MDVPGVHMDREPHDARMPLPPRAGGMEGGVERKGRSERPGGRLRGTPAHDGEGAAPRDMERAYVPVCGPERNKLAVNSFRLRVGADAVKCEGGIEGRRRRQAGGCVEGAGGMHKLSGDGGRAGFSDGHQGRGN